MYSLLSNSDVSNMVIGAYHLTFSSRRRQLMSNAFNDNRLQSVSEPNSSRGDQSTVHS